MDSADDSLGSGNLGVGRASLTIVKLSGALRGAVVMMLLVAGCSNTHSDRASASSTPPDSSEGNVPLVFVSLYTNDSNVEHLGVFSTATGNATSALAITGPPAGLGLTDLSSLHVGDQGREVFWTSVDAAVTRTGEVVETPIAGGPSRIVTNGVVAIPSPDGDLLFVEEKSLEGGREFAGFKVVNLDTNAVTLLLPNQPLLPYETFSWLPDSQTLLAFYPAIPDAAGLVWIVFRSPVVPCRPLGRSTCPSPAAVGRQSSRLAQP